MIRLSSITEERIRERAYRLWLEEGQPEGKASEHWEKARELLALESDPEEGKETPGEDHDSRWDEPETPKRLKVVAARRTPSASKRRPM